MKLVVCYPAVFVCCSLISACGSPGDFTAESDPAQQGTATLSQSRPEGHGHIMPVASLRQPMAKKNSSNLSYYGGPVLSNVKVFIVEWGKAVSIPSNKGNATASDLGTFFAGVTNSSYFSWLKEYNTKTQEIGDGSFVGSYVDSKVPFGKTVDDTQIQSELVKLAEAGTIPENDGNMLYFVYFPAGVNVTMGGEGSCETFCAYHGTALDKAGKYLFYAVMPDQGGACAGGCGYASNQFDNTTSVSSHELIEAVTDPAVGQASAEDAPPLAWYNDIGGEIGDICNAEQGTVVDKSGKTWTVQKQWSNYDNACVTTSSAPAGSATSPLPSN